MSVAIFIGSTARITVSNILDFDGLTVVATGIVARIYDKNETLVDTATLQDQGGGVWQGSFSPQSLVQDAKYNLEIITTADTGALLTQRETFLAKYKGWA